jgi:AraC-like DNA-binding protein
MDRQHIFLYETRMRPVPPQTRFVENLHALFDPRWDGALARVPRAGHVICGPEYAVSRDRSPGFDILWCIAGCGTVRTAGREVAVLAGQCAAISGDRPHGHVADPADPWTLLWLRVAGAEAEAAIAVLFGVEGGTIPIVQGAPLAAWFGRLFDAMRARGPNLDPTLNQLVAELWPILNAERLALTDRRLPAPIERLTAAMSAQPAAPWPMADMQAVARISPAQLRRQFRTHLQTTPREWLRHERILLAQDLLLRPGARVAAVADACGFADIYHFSREFRRTVGLPPTLWRQAEGSSRGGPIADVAFSAPLIQKPRSSR